MKFDRQSPSRTLKLEVLESRVLFGNAADLLLSGAADLVNDQTLFMGNVYNGFEIISEEAVFASLPGTITRISFLDAGGDLVFAEFGSDDPETTLRINLEDYTADVPSPYTQPGTTYARGLATFTIDKSTGLTFFSVFSLGSDPTRVDNALINANTFTESTDNIATVRSIIVNDSTAGQIGGINADNAIFTAGTGEIGILAPSIDFRFFASIGDIDALDTAIPRLQLGPQSEIESFNVRGGDLVQDNGERIGVSGFDAVVSTEGTTSRFDLLPRVEFETSVFEPSQEGSIVLLTIPPVDPPAEPPMIDPGSPPDTTPPPQPD